MKQVLYKHILFVNINTYIVFKLLSFFFCTNSYSKLKLILNFQAYNYNLQTNSNFLISVS